MKKEIFENQIWLAEFQPECGGNMIRLKHKATGTDILRVPPNEAAFVKQPEVWGLPCLFPPNRIRDGWFEFEGRRYELPVNERPTLNHIHGFLLRHPWTWSCEGNIVTEKCVFSAVPGWPHDFTAIATFDFSGEIMKHTISFTNNSGKNMPFMLGYHTTLNTPDDAAIHMPCGNKIQIACRLLPNGKVIESDWQDGRCAGPKPYIDTHLFAKTENGLHGVELTIPSQKVKIVYKTDPQYAFWMVWNGSGGNGFCCPEPQTCCVDAPNLKTDFDTGFSFIEPNGIKELYQTFQVEKI